MLAEFLFVVKVMRQKYIGRGKDLTRACIIYKGNHPLIALLGGI